MKDKRISIALGVLVMVLVLICGLFLIEKKIASDKIKAETVFYEVRGYNLVMHMRLPKEKYEYKLIGELYPDYPSFEVKNKIDNFIIKGKVVEELKAEKTLAISRIKADVKEKKIAFKEMQADQKSGRLGWYGYGVNSEDAIVMVDLNRENKDKYYALRMEVERTGVNNGKNMVEDARLMEVIGSIRIKKNTNFKNDYIAPNSAVFKVKKIEDEIDDYKIEQKSKNINMLNLIAKKDKEVIVVSLYPIAGSRSLDKVIESDYYVKKGEDKYGKLEKDGEKILIRSTTVKDKGQGRQEMKSYIKKEGGVVYMEVNFSEVGKDVAMKIRSQVIKNIIIDAERMKKFYH